MSQIFGDLFKNTTDVILHNLATQHVSQKSVKILNSHGLRDTSGIVWPDYLFSGCYRYKCPLPCESNTRGSYVCIARARVSLLLVDGGTLSHTKRNSLA